ncbi:KH domain-containing protein [Bacillus sp. HMF5848]|uniref:KH domain-containing protein n=1 Tax=Bacillus sp. HMF5848 TaxID=2495421 RepID=UPI000F79C10C|nr:KH domain-containing protein [Bacillus sp. HMF5848]RSK27004.1 KH domain-containing protein [Bacillus sp. HMF5848]
MKELIETIVKALVDHPNDVTVSEKETEKSIHFELSVNKEDMGKVIGKQGRVAKAVRTVVYAAGAQQNKKIHLDITE